MNKVERILNTLGRLRSAYASGLKASPNADFNDPRAWSSYGPSVAGGAGKGKKPQSAEDALEYYASWVYICVSLNARACASVPLRLYGTVKTRGGKIKWAGTDVPVQTRPVTKARRKEFERARHLQPYMTKAAEVEEITEHPFLDLIQNVNPYSNMSDLLEITVMFMDLTGDAYWYLVKNGAGVPEAIWSMPSQYIEIVPGESLGNFIKGYKFTRGQTVVELPFEDVLTFAYPNPKNQLYGFSPVIGVADAVYNNSQMNIYEASLFENKARVDGLFEVDSTVAMSTVERASEKFKAEFAGAERAGKRPVLPPGMKFTPTSMTAEDIAFIEGRRLSREEIAAGLDVPISLLDPNSIRSNVDGAAVFHQRYGITPRLRKIEEKLNERLLPMYDSGSGLFVAFDSAIDEDKDFLLRERQVSVGVPWASVDEARSAEGKEPLNIPGVSDVPASPFGMAPLGSDPGYSAADDQARDLAERTMKALRERLGG